MIECFCFLPEMDEECFPTVSMNTACGRLSADTVTVKDEPVSETDSMHSSCPPSPQPSFLHLTESMDTEVVSNQKTKIFKVLHFYVRFCIPEPTGPAQTRQHNASIKRHAVHDDTEASQAQHKS